MVQLNRKMYTITVAWTLWQILFLCPLVKADPTTMQCPSGRERTAEEWLIGAAWYKTNVIRQHAGVKYAGDEVTPRPMPKRTIVYFSQRSQRYKPQSGAIIWFSFISDAMKNSYREAIPARAKDFWCLVQPGDTLLLSDGVTHHFAIVSHLDATSGRIFFIDPWPESFFLLKNRNALDVQASISEESPAVAFSNAPALVHQQILTNSLSDILQSLDLQGSDPMAYPEWYRAKTKLVSITQQEFERAIVGLSTSGSVEMMDYYLRLSPTLAKDFTTYRGFGLTMLQAGNQFSAQSAQALGAARVLAKTGGQRDEEVFLASRQYLALALTHHAQQREGQESGSDSVSGTLRELGFLEKEYGGKALIKDYSSKDLVRLGNASVSAGDLDRALGWLDAAITTNSRDAAAYLNRSIAKIIMMSLDGTEDDVSTAIRLLSQDEVAIRAKAATVDRKAVDEWQDVGADLTDVLNLKAQALQHRATVSLLTNKCAQARSDISELGRTLGLLRQEPSDGAKRAISSVQEKCSSK